MSETTFTEPTAPDAGVDTPAPEAAAPTLEEEMGAVFDAAQEADAPAAPGAEETPPEGMMRGPDGRFVAQDGAEKAPEVAAPEQPAPQAQPATPDYIAPYAADFEARGLRPDQAVGRLLDTWKKLESNPESTLKWLASQYGVEWGGRQPAPAPAAQAPADPDVWVDPAVAALKAEMAEIKNWKTQNEAQSRAAAERSYDASLQQVTNEIQTFAKTKATAGHFDALRPHMATLIQSGEADTLEQAYEMATWANPTTRAAKIEADRKISEANRAKLDAEKLASARRAAVTNIRSDVSAPGKALTMEESLARSYDEIASRG